MENEIVELKEEIDILNERISFLEKKNRERQAYTYIKILIKVILLFALIFGIWRGYEYVVHEIPKIMEEKIKELNPLKK